MTRSNEVTAVIPHYPVGRTTDLKRAVSALYSGSVTPERVLVWDNTNELDLSGWDVPAVVMGSPFNVGCFARFYAALCVTTPYVLFQDNDLMLGHKALEVMLQYQKVLSSHVVTSLHGYIIGESYHGRKYIDRVPKLTHVNVTTGRAELVPTDVVRRTMTRLFRQAESGTKNELFPKHDDLWFSAQCRALSVMCYVVPQVGVSDLPSHVTGMCSQPGHYEERDRVYRALFQEGMGNG